MGRLGYLAGCAVAAVLLATGCRVLPGISAAAPASPAAKPVTVVRGMMSAFRLAESVHVSGTVSQTGQAGRIDMVLTRSGGVAGTLTQGGITLQVLTTGGVTYLRVDKGLIKLVKLPAAACPQYCGKYVQFPAATGRQLTGDIGWTGLMGPISAGFSPVAQAVTPAMPASLLKRAMVSGQPAWKIAGTGQPELYIAAQGTPYLLHMTGPGIDASFTDWNLATIPPPPAASQLVTPGQLANA